MEDLKISERWREYYQTLMNEENPREGRNEQQAVVEDAITESPIYTLKGVSETRSTGKLLDLTTYR